LFSPPELPTEKQLENEEFDEEELEELVTKLELDYQIGEDIKEKAGTDFYPRHRFHD
jgi:nucleosome assembly protein 1-like 1